MSEFKDLERLDLETQLGLYRVLVAFQRGLIVVLALAFLVALFW